MELMLVPVPLFDKYMAVEAYIFRYQLANQAILSPTQNVSPPLEALNDIGSEAFAGGNPILVPVSAQMLLSLATNCTQPPDTTVFYLEDLSSIEDLQLRSIAKLKKRGYSIALMQSDGYIDNDPLLKLTDYVLFGENAMAGSDRKALVIRYTRYYKRVKVVATGLDTHEQFAAACADGFHLYEGLFYRVPVYQADRGLTPLKANLIRLLNLVRDENFEFSDIAAVMRQDTALSYSLMRFINSPYLGIRHKVKSIQQAVTILGQIEVRKWVTAAVFKPLCAPRPNELTRISLVRAKFAENLAELFDMDDDASSLFLMGLFSVLDVMLDCTMQQALERVLVSDDIAAALISGEGAYFPVLDYIVCYERADWPEIVRHNMVHGIYTPEVYSAYLNAVSWYNELLSARVPSSHRNTSRPTSRLEWR